MNQPDPRITILVVDDVEIWRRGLRDLPLFDDRITIVAEADDGPTGIALAHRHRPRIVLMDIRMNPGMNGVEATGRLAKELPDTAVIILSSWGGESLVRQALAAGAAGYLIKDDPLEVLAGDIASFADGRAAPFRGPGMVDIVRRILKGLAPTETGRLSPRELDVMRHLAEGKPDSLIARQMNIARHTLHNHISSIRKKLDVADRRELVDRARTITTNPPC